MNHVTLPYPGPVLGRDGGNSVAIGLVVTPHSRCGKLAVLPADGNVLVVGRFGKTNLVRILVEDHGSRPDTTTIVVTLSAANLIGIFPTEAIAAGEHDRLVADLDRLTEQFTQRADQREALTDRLVLIVDDVPLDRSDVLWRINRLAFYASAAHAQVVLTTTRLRNVQDRTLLDQFGVRILLGGPSQSVMDDVHAVLDAAPWPDASPPADERFAWITDGHDTDEIEIYFHRA